jgi:hypothetical protein
MPRMLKSNWTLFVCHVSQLCNLGCCLLFKNVYVSVNTKYSLAAIYVENKTRNNCLITITVGE